MQSETIPFCKKFVCKESCTPVYQLLDELALFESGTFPSADDLNHVVKRYCAHWEGPKFKGQRTFAKHDKRYYETIISEDNVVPTREESWHDLFNAIIWLQFPKTKSMLNTLHIEDIDAFGVNPRTPRRNRITHFDECGVILAVEEDVTSPDLAGLRESAVLLERFLQHLAAHKWEEVFITQRNRWWNDVTPFVFGHANLEMMLTPFLGLTGKWLAVSVPSGFRYLDKWQQRRIVDEALVARIKHLDNFQCSPILKPIPLLGIPHWHHAQTEAFYQNSDYFRPLRANAKPTVQLPLWSTEA